MWVSRQALMNLEMVGSLEQPSRSRLAAPVSLRATLAVQQGGPACCEAALGWSAKSCATPAHDRDLVGTCPASFHRSLAAVIRGFQRMVLTERGTIYGG